MTVRKDIRACIRNFPAALIFGLIFAAFLSGCSSMINRVVKPGDNVVVNYTCRLKSGEVVLTTREETANDTSSHAEIFLPYKKYGPEDFVAGRPDDHFRYGKLKIFEREVAAQIARAVVGMKVGENNTILIRSETPPDLADQDRYISLYRSSREDKEQHVGLDEVRNMLGHDPVEGEKAFSYQGITGTVKSVKGKDVVIHLDVKDGQVVDQPFGKGVIRDYPDHYDIVTDAKVGHLVRSMSQVGRISSVTDEKFTIDYGNAFGGEELLCDVTVESILPGAEDRDPKKAGEKQP